MEKEEKKPAAKKTVARKPRAAKAKTTKAEPKANAKTAHHEDAEIIADKSGMPAETGNTTAMDDTGASPDAAAENVAHKTTDHKTEKGDKAEKTVKHEGRYVYAVGRRKTSVANVRMFHGKEKSLVNKKDILSYFGNQSYVDQALKPLQLTGMESQVYVYVNIKGGGINSQSQAIAHGLATAIANDQPDFRKVLKKNGMLTRDSRMKERKKPGLKRARRGPQWAKR